MAAEIKHFKFIGGIKRENSSNPGPSSALLENEPETLETQLRSARRGRAVGVLPPLCVKGICHCYTPSL